MNRATPTYWAIMPAAGVGQRMNSHRPKQYLPLLGKTVIEHSLERLLALPEIEAVLVVTNAEDKIWPSLAISRDPRIETVSGGNERHRSVFNGMLALDNRADGSDWVLVHDAVRPCVTVDSIRNLMEQLAGHEVGGVLGYRLSDTLKKINPELGVEATLDRNAVWAAATPQMFRYGLLRKALARQVEVGSAPTDEAMAVEQLNLQPQMVAGSRDNIKITVVDDLRLAELILQARNSRPPTPQSKAEC
ncbi:MAG: 2-C-methyl-D-erythritol 4-phosphate cytidylyltransferase [Cellvibrionaceae bacterium]